jgi:hypothetical protein
VQHACSIQHKFGFKKPIFEPYRFSYWQHAKVVTLLNDGKAEQHQSPHQSIALSIVTSKRKTLVCSALCLLCLWWKGNIIPMWLLLQGLQHVLNSKHGFQPTELGQHLDCYLHRLQRGPLDIDAIFDLGNVKFGQVEMDYFSIRMG